MGIVKSCPRGEFSIGAKVAAVMGGLDRAINSSYAEYARALASNGVLIESDLPGAEPWAIPETYATAWTCQLGPTSKPKMRERGPMPLNGCATLARPANKCFTSMM